jgi:hypothetical protein
MRATRLMFVLLLSSSLLAPPASLAKGKGHDQGRGGKDRVERVEKDRGEKRGKGERAKKARAERQRSEKAREVRQVRASRADDRWARPEVRERGRQGRERQLRDRREAQLREQHQVRLRERQQASQRAERQRNELREQRRQVEVRQQRREAELRQQRREAQLREQHRVSLRAQRQQAQLREQREVRLREQRQVRLREQRQAELRQQRRQVELREQRRAEVRLHERERDRLHHLVARMRDGWNDDDRDDRRVRVRDRRAAVPAQIRFRGLDRNGDGRISGREWRGNRVSFRNHDWNGDGVLTGAEVIPGARKPRRFDRIDDRVRVVRREVRLDPIFTFRSDPFGRRVVLPPRPLVTRIDQAFLVAPRFQPVRTVRRVVPRTDVTVIDLGLDLDDRFGLLALPVTLALADALVDDVDVVVRAGRFAAFDSDLDGYVTPVEWPAGRRSFRSYDRDDDLLLVRDELYVDDDLLVVDRDRLLLFHGLDRDDDGLIAPWEWPGDLDSFFLRDFDGDAVISLDEFMGLVDVDYGVRAYRYDALDFDRDGRVARVEWVGDPVRFTRLDRDADGMVGRWEYGVGWVLDV